MAEAIPLLNIGRSVQNISSEHIAGLESRLVKEARDFSSEPEAVAEGMVSPANRLYSQIISSSEFFGIQQRLGEDRLGHDALEELEAQLEETLSGLPKKLDVPTLGVIKSHWGEFPKFALRIAYSAEAAKERWLAQTVIINFLDRESPPKGWFTRAKRTVPVQLARSHNQEQLQLLNRLAIILEEEQLLPSVTHLGEPKLRTFTKRS